MFKRKTVNVLASIGFAIMALSAAGAASASTISCGAIGGDLALKVSNSSACLILEPLGGPLTGQSNDSVDPPPSSFTVNQENFFGINTWLFDGKFDTSTGADDSSLVNFEGGTQSGTYSIAPANTDYQQLMFVFKDGNNTNLVAYLINFGAGSGTYATPFTNPPFSGIQGGSKDISHISVYYTTDPGGPSTGVPEPGTVALLGVGLLGAAVRRVRSQRA